VASDQGGAVPRRRAWPVRAAGKLVLPFAAALVTGEADPPGPRPAWRHPRRLQLLTRVLPIARFDVVVAAEAVIAFFIFVGTLSQVSGGSGEGPVAALAALAASVPVLLRERWPLAAWRAALPFTVFVLLVTGQAYGGDSGTYPAGAVIMYLLVLYAVGVRCPREVSLGVWAISVLTLFILNPDTSVYLGALMTGVALIYGYNVRVRRAAQRRAAEEEQRTEEERGAREVLEERSRIARELHDVVAHHMSVIAIQAEAAPIKAPDDPEALKRELAEIRLTALEALTELRRILGVLRQSSDTAGTAPQPGLADVDTLVASSRAAGQQVTLTTAGRPRPIPPGLGLTAYRILQESLSNALRHAPGAPVQVRLDYLDGELRLRVENEPAPQPPTAPRSRGGHGLAGMRERVGTAGGSLTTGPTDTGGFLVAATLPLEQP
jgi:signal transduction histidine kinase